MINKKYLKLLRTKDRKYGENFISPEGCASILWRNTEFSQEAAKTLKLTSADCKNYKIIDDHGESYFRNIEEETCLDLLQQNNCVISLGGGSIINKKIRKEIKKYSYSIYLQVTITNLVERLKSSKKRPLLNTNLSKRIMLKNLYDDRRNFYENADLIVNNDNDKFQVLDKIKSALNLYAK